MTLSAKQIIAELEAVADKIGQTRHSGAAESVDAAIAYIKAMQPRPVHPKPPQGEPVLIYSKEGECVGWWDGFYEGWMVQHGEGECSTVKGVTGWLPLDALPLPEGE